MKLWMLYLAVGSAGALGAVARLSVQMVCLRLFGAAFPVGTLVANISGCIFLGWFITAAGERLAVSDATRLAVAAGFLGAYTTFSTFIFESDALLKNGSEFKALANLLGSLLMGLVALRAGIWLAGR